MAIAGLLLLVLVVAVVSARGMQKIVDDNLKAWQDVARQLGLRFQGGEQERTISGQLDGVSVRATYRMRGQAYPSDDPQHPAVMERVTFRAAENGCIPASLVVRRDQATRLLGVRFGGRDVAIGDATFDELVELPGLDAWSCAALSHTARLQLLRFLKRGGEVRRGTLWCEMDGSAEHERDSLLSMLQFLAQLGKSLSVTSEALHQRLRANALHDPGSGVRWRNLRFLADPRTQTPPELLLSTARTLLGDRSGAVRTLAARQLEEEGLPVLRAEAADAQAHPEVRSAALQALAELEAPDLEPQLGALLALPGAPELLLSTALGIAAARGLHGLLPAVARCSKHESESVRRSAAAALGKLAGSEAALLDLLSDPSPPVQQAAVESLGEAGSVRAVEPLLPLSRGLVPSSLRSTARASITQIQGRLGPAEAGRVSLADQQQLLVGAVDLADVSVAVRAGELSLTDDVDDSDGSDTRLRGTSSRRSDMS